MQYLCQRADTVQSREAARITLLAVKTSTSLLRTAIGLTAVQVVLISILTLLSDIAKRTVELAGNGFDCSDSALKGAMPSMVILLLYRSQISEGLVHWWSLLTGARRKIATVGPGTLPSELSS